MRPLFEAAYRHVCAALPDVLSEKVQHLRCHKRWPNLASPSTFNEKVMVRKLTENSSLFVECADKVLVKDRVERTVGRKYLIPTLWHGKVLPQAPPDAWPRRFVVKASHASGWNRFWYGRPEESWAELKAKADGWVETEWGDWLHERWYNRIDRQILVEEMIGEPGSPPPDFKFFVFDGQVRMIQVDSDRFSGHRRDLFDPQWNRLDATLRHPGSGVDTPRPPHLDEMIEVAGALGAGIDFVRVDLYDLPTGPLFGEMTFTPGAGLERFSPASLDAEVGAHWRFALPS